MFRGMREAAKGNPVRVTLAGVSDAVAKRLTSSRGSISPGLAETSSKASLRVRVEMRKTEV